MRAFGFAGGVSRGTNLLWEINGIDGDLQLTAAGGQAHLFEVDLRGGDGRRERPASHALVTATMRAVVLDAPGPPEALRIREIPVPEPRPGWVLIRVQAFGINRSELHTRLVSRKGSPFRACSASRRPASSLRHPEASSRRANRSRP